MEPHRYLWTDAFGVVNYLSLACETGERRYLDQAAGLINGRQSRCGAAASLHKLWGRLPWLACNGSSR